MRTILDCDDVPYTVALISMILSAATPTNGANAAGMWWRRSLSRPGFVLCTQAGSSTLGCDDQPGDGGSGVVTCLPMFWALPTSFLGGAGAAAGIALVNCTGNLAGFFSPAIIGFLRDYTHKRRTPA